MHYKRPNYTARNVLKSPSLSNATMDEIKRVVKHECELCKTTPTPSCLRVGAVKDLTSFKWESLVKELQNTARVDISLVCCCWGINTS